MTIKHAGWLLMTIMLTVGLVGFGGCDSGGGNRRQNTKPAVGERADMKAVEELSENAFTKYFTPVKTSVSPAVPAYELPLKPADIANYDHVMEKLEFNPVADKIAQNGFGVIDKWQVDKIETMYEILQNLDVPNFITTDSLLHLYHVQFGKTLKDIEEKQFHPQLLELTTKLQNASKSQYDTLPGELHEAARLNWAYFTVARKLLEPGAPVAEQIEDEVEAELKLIDDHDGFSESPIFIYNEDYSQYVPRGHYTRSETLQQYFKTMMWYGRISMLLVGKDLNPAAIVEQPVADRQTLQAALIAGLLTSEEDALKGAYDTWHRIYEVTAFYVGLADDLMPTQYSTALRKVLGASWEWGALLEEGTLGKLREQLATLGAPRIYGGTGKLEVQPPFTPEQLKEALATTTGMRFMGQRFVPDSYMMGKLVVPTVGVFTGQGEPFTLVQAQGGPVRGFPRGLDVMSILGSERAAQILAEAGDTAYENYDTAVGELKAEFAAMGENAWHKNLYWSWLNCLRPLLKPMEGEGIPTFMTTEAWADRNLNTALSSWAQLRHDTILYAKQSYTVGATALPPMAEKKIVGYVEPVPEFYARLLELTTMTRAGLQALEVLDEEATRRLDSLAEILQRLLSLSEQELANKELTDEDYKFIEDIAGHLKWVVAGVEDQGLETTIVADVHTDGNSGNVLEEGTGYLRIMLVAYKMPQGHLVMGAGPVLSYYEFKHPMSDRLTDEKWRAMLGSGQAPAAPEWISSFYAAE
jgi:hypothetical protein